jgi:hypothetical protein
MTAFCVNGCNRPRYGSRTVCKGCHQTRRREIYQSNRQDLEEGKLRAKPKPMTAAEYEASQE